jgi:3',5'-cyclic AMP phosphodiesterase CpdA
MMLEDGAALAAVISRHGHVERVLCGHVHRSVQCRFAGTIGQIAPDTALETSLHRARADCCADRSCP